MGKITRILLTSVGGYFGFKNIEYFKKCLGNKVWIIATDATLDRIPEKLSDKFFKVPLGNSKNYVKTIHNISKKFNIDFIFPCSDEEATILSRNKKKFEKIKVTIACQTLETNKIITNKILTYKTLKSNSMIFPDFKIVYSFEELLNIANLFFLKYSEFVIKEPTARGNRGTLVISKNFKKCKNFKNSRELHMSYKYFKFQFKNIINTKFPLIVSERLFPPSYDLDVLSSNGNFYFSIARERVNPAGVPFKGNIIRQSDKLKSLAKKACQTFKLSWITDIDVMTNRSGDPVLLEINPRASGSISISMFLGIPIYKNLLQIYNKEKLSPFIYPKDGIKVISEKKNSLKISTGKIKIICIIQARMSSTRLPGKSLALINNVPCIERVIKRVNKSKLINDIWVACSRDRSDDVLESFVRNMNVNCYRGSMEDVLSRYIGIYNKTSADYIVRITGDCPLIDPEVIDEVIKKILVTGADFSSNTIKRSFPDGLDIEVFTGKALVEADKKSKHKFMREHVTPYMSGKLSKKFNSGKFNIVQVLNNKNYSNIRLTLDREEDLTLLNELYKHLDNFCTLEQIINFLQKEKHLLNINKHIEYNEKSNKYYD